MCLGWCFTLTQRNPDRVLNNSQVNLKGDEIAQLTTDYTPLEMVFFKAVVCVMNSQLYLAHICQVEQIILAPRETFSVSSIICLQELHAAKMNITKSQAEAALASFVAKGWLRKSQYV